MNDKDQADWTRAIREYNREMDEKNKKINKKIIPNHSKPQSDNNIESI